MGCRIPIFDFSPLRGLTRVGLLGKERVDPQDVRPQGLTRVGFFGAVRYSRGGGCGGCGTGELAPPWGGVGQDGGESSVCRTPGRSKLPRPAHPHSRPYWARVPSPKTTRAIAARRFVPNFAEWREQFAMISPGELERYFQQRTEQHAFSGVVLITQGSSQLFAGSYGYASRPWKVPN